VIDPGAAAPRPVVFEDPFVKASKTEPAAGDRPELRFPLIEAEALPEVIEEVKVLSRDVFGAFSSGEIQESMRRLDAFFADPGQPEVRAAVDLIRRIDGFSQHDIERFGLGIFRPIVEYDRSLVGRFVEEAFRTRRPVETVFGHLRRFGVQPPFTAKRSPRLISHFASGNVAGYSAILVRIGLPLSAGKGGGEWGRGAAQIFKLPSTSAVFPMLYLSKMNEIAPLVRRTIACGYWRGGDRAIEDRLLSASDAINVLGAEGTVRDIEERVKRLARRPAPVVLGHGHKVGAAYVAREFAESADLRGKAIAGLVEDISAFDGAACYSTKNIYVQGDHRKFAEELAGALGRHAAESSPVNPGLKAVGRSIGRIYEGAGNVLAAGEDAGFVRVADKTAFWFPDEVFRYVQVMPAESMKAAAAIMSPGRHFLQTVVAAVPDEQVLSALDIFGEAGASNVHHPGSAPLLNVYEEPHDGDFDFVKVRYPYRVRFAATNFKRNADWIGLA
jgi:hypothetical protein